MSFSVTRLIIWSSLSRDLPCSFQTRVLLPDDLYICIRVMILPFPENYHHQLLNQSEGFLIGKLCYLPPIPLHMESTVQLQIACVQLLPHVPSLITLEYLSHCCGSSISIESFLSCFQSWLQNLLVLFMFGLEKRDFNHQLKTRPPPSFFIRRLFNSTF